MRHLFLLLGLCALLAAAAFAVRAEEEPSATEGAVVGRPAPDLRLNDQTGRAVRLQEFGEGHWTVLAFYPKALTPG